MSTSTPTILVAGGAGYIGSHTAKQLQRTGYLPVVLDNLVTGNRSSARFGPFHEGSIADEALVRSLVSRYQIAGVILFAGHAYVGESIHEPRKYFANNIAASIAFLNALLDANVSKLVFSSSCSIYGTQQYLPIAENAPKGPLSPYAETKLILEKILFAYDSAYNFRAVCLRYFNVAGADPEGEIGENHDPETHLIPLTIQAAMGGAPLKVLGTDYDTADGTAVRDYINVTDLAEVHVSALRYLLDGGASTQLNCGSGEGHSVREVIAMVEKVSGKPVPASYFPRREGDAKALVADVSEVGRVLGWQTKASSLETIVETAWKWYTQLKTGEAPNRQGRQVVSRQV